MELAWLEDFVAVGKLRNFSKAAITRHATQSAVSRRIKALEDWYGARLIDRGTHPITLTDAGSAFLAVCEELITELYRSRREARAELGAAGRMIRFTMPHSLAVNFFPKWWRETRAQADLSARVVAADLAECIELLLSGSCQFLLHYSNPDINSGLENINLQRRKVGAERLVPVCGTSDKGKPLFDFSDPDQAGVIPLLTYTSGSFLGRVAARVHAQLEARWRLVLRYESSLVEALKAEAVLGEGIAWLPEGNIRQEIQSGRLCVINDPGLMVPLEIWLCSPPSARVPDSARRLLVGADSPDPSAQ